MITILPYQPHWPAEFAALGSALRQAVGDLALRIDHIGSTAVPGLAAKDLIDIQITVGQLDPALKPALESVGYRWLEGIEQDHLPPATTSTLDEWRKWLFKSFPDRRPVNVHIRCAGRANQRYPLLFRDYLRAHPMSAGAYAQVKLALAKYHPNDMEAYYEVKDPACDLIIEGAEIWAATMHWQMGPSDC